TLAELAHVALDGAQGRSLLGVIATGGGEDAPIFFGATADESGIGLGRWKLLRRGETTLLFDLAADPSERVDLAAQRPDVVRSLAGLLDTRRAQDEARAAERSRGGKLSITDAERRK